MAPPERVVKRVFIPLETSPIEKVSEPAPVIQAISAMEINGRLSALQAKLAADIAVLRGDAVATSRSVQSNATYISNVYNTVASSNNIDRIQDVRLIDPAITGGSVTNTS